MKIPRIFAFAMLIAVAQTSLYAQKAQTSFKFDFGPGKPADGFTQVTPNTVYSQETGFGFDLNTSVTGVERGGKDLLKADFVTAKQPFYFSVNVPEGNYQITLTLGDLKGPSATTVKAESRRLMLENVQTKAGKFVTKTFVVNIKDRRIDDQTQVKLKPRELTKLDWDNKLTLEFDLEPALVAMEITRVDHRVTVFLAGNSTVVNQDGEPWASWGQMIPLYFKPGAAIANHAESGLALSSFAGSNRLKKILSVIQPGDYVFVEFGHNDEKEKGPNDGAYKSYTDRLRTFVAEVKKAQGNPVIVTPTARRSFAGGKIVNTHGDYPDAARKVALEEHVPLIDLTAKSTQLFETMGEEGSRSAFVVIGDKIDNTHFNTYGAYELAKIIVQSIREKIPALATHLIKTPDFDPAHPDPVALFNWSPSPKADFIKPDGN